MENLDYEPPVLRHLNKAKSLFYILLACAFFSIAVTVLGKGLRGNTIGMIIALPWLMILVLSPLALVHIIKSYRHKEVHQHKIWYLIGIVFFNAVLLFLIVNIVWDIYLNFLN